MLCNPATFRLTLHPDFLPNSWYGYRGQVKIIGFLREADAGVPIVELCRRHGFSEASFYLWRNKFGGMSVSDAKRLKELEGENTRLKRLLANAMLENEVIKEALQKKW